MSSFKKKLKDNIITPYNKYSLSHEKVAEVLATNSDKNTCSVMYKNVDGVLVTKHDVPYKKTTKGILHGFPKVGDYVEITEVGNIIRISDVCCFACVIISSSTTPVILIIFPTSVIST